MMPGDGTEPPLLLVVDAAPFAPFDPGLEWGDPTPTGRVDDLLAPPAPGEVVVDLETVRPGSLAVLSIRRWLAERSEARAAGQLHETYGEDLMKPAVAAVKLRIPIDESRLPRDFTRREERDIVKHRAKTKGSKALGMQEWGLQKSAHDIGHSQREVAARNSGGNPYKKWRTKKVWSSRYSRGVHKRTGEAISTLVGENHTAQLSESELEARRQALAAAAERANNLRDREARTRRARDEQRRRALRSRAGRLQDRASQLAETAERQALGQNPDGTDAERFLGAQAAWNEYRAGVVAARAQRLEQRADDPSSQTRTGRAVRRVGRGILHSTRTVRHGGKIVRERIADSRIARLESSGHELNDRSINRLSGLSIPFYEPSRYVDPVTAYGYGVRGAQKIERASHLSTKARERRAKKYGTTTPDTSSDMASPEPTRSPWAAPTVEPRVDTPTESHDEPEVTEALDMTDPTIIDALSQVIDRMAQPGSPEQAEWQARKAQFEAEDHSTDGRTLENLRDEWAAEVEQRARAEVSRSRTA